MIVHSNSYSGVPKTFAVSGHRAYPVELPMIIAVNASQRYSQEIITGIAVKLSHQIDAGIIVENQAGRLTALFPEILAEKLLRDFTGIPLEMSWHNCCGTITTIPDLNSRR